jgi:hypothetical protein
LPETVVATAGIALVMAEVEIAVVTGRVEGTVVVVDLVVTEGVVVAGTGEGLAVSPQAAIINSNTTNIPTVKAVGFKIINAPDSIFSLVLDFRDEYTLK